MDPSDFNVIITNNSRSAISEIFGFIQLNHLHQFKYPLFITHETSKFEATCSRVPLLKGWHSVINADPQLLLDRGYDKVICIQRDLLDLCEDLAEYHENAFTKKELIQLFFKRPKFFSNIKKQHDLLNKEIEDQRYLKISLEDWNHFTLETYNTLLDFLEFPQEERLQVIPIKFTEKERNFKGYSCSHLPKDYIVSEKIQRLREHG